MHMQPAQNRLRELREAKGVTLKQVGDACDVYGSTVKHWQNTYIPGKYLGIVAAMLGVSVDYLIGLPDDDGQEKAAA